MCRHVAKRRPGSGKQPRAGAITALVSSSNAPVARGCTGLRHGKAPTALPVAFSRVFPERPSEGEVPGKMWTWSS
jgi:hypothetical protein